MSRREKPPIRRKPSVDPLESRHLLSGAADFHVHIWQPNVLDGTPTIDVRPIVIIKVIDAPKTATTPGDSANSLPPVSGSSSTDQNPGSTPISTPGPGSLRTFLSNGWTETTIGETGIQNTSPPPGSLRAILNSETTTAGESAAANSSAPPQGSLRDILNPPPPTLSSSDTQPPSTTDGPWGGFSPPKVIVVHQGDPVPFDMFQTSDPTIIIVHWHSHDDGGSGTSNNPGSNSSSTSATSSSEGSGQPADDGVWLAPWGSSDDEAEAGSSSSEDRSDEASTDLPRSMDGDLPFSQRLPSPSAIVAIRLRGHGPASDRGLSAAGGATDSLAEDDTLKGKAGAGPTREPGLPGDDEVEAGDVPPAVGSDLLANFPAADGDSLGAAVDRFLEQLPVLGAAFSRADDAPDRASWPLIWTAGLLGLELGRRVARRRSNNGDDDAEPCGPPRVRGAHDPLTGWPGSWSARVP